MLKWIVRAIFIFIAGSILWVTAYRVINPPITATMIAARVETGHLNKRWLSLDKLDRNMVRAAIAAEDSRFCQHKGFDTDAIEKALERNKSGKTLRGGSTISQQTAKNAFLWQGRSWLRKGLEAWFTVLIELIWDKRRIMEVYLNIAETGIGTFGANAGAMRYFGHDARKLTPHEAARIAAVLPLPQRREAINPAGFTLRYGNSIRKRMDIVRRDRLDTCIYQ